MAVFRFTLIVACLLVARSAVASDLPNVTDVIQAGQNLKEGLLNKNSPSPSPPPSGPYIPAPVSVQVSATEAPTPTKAPQTNPPATSSTKPPPTTTAAPPVASCVGQANGTHCVTGTANIIGGRCVSGTCQGTTVTFCTAKGTCVVGPNAGKSASYCDPSTDAVPAGYNGILEVGTATVGCNSAYDCPLGYWCDSFYVGTSTGSAGGCVLQC